MTLSRQTVVRIAELARLELNAGELAHFERDLGRILEYVALLSELDTSEVPETAQIAVEAAPLRSDVVYPGLTSETALSESARHNADGFLVPGFVEES